MCFAYFVGWEVSAGMENDESTVLYNPLWRILLRSYPFESLRITESSAMK